MQQILTGRRSVGFFINIYQAVFCSIGFIIFHNSHFIFRKLSFRSISLVYRLISLAFLYGYIEPRLFVGDLAKPLLTSWVSSAGGVT
jgi:hypothetical protein